MKQLSGIVGVLVVVVLLVFMFEGCDSFDYTVQVVDNTFSPVEGAAVIIFVAGKPPLIGQTDNQGFTMIRIGRDFYNRNGKLTVQHPDYDNETHFISLVDGIPFQVVLDPAPTSGVPSPAPPPVPSVPTPVPPVVLDPTPTSALPPPLPPTAPVPTSAPSSVPSLDLDGSWDGTLQANNGKKTMVMVDLEQDKEGSGVSGIRCVNDVTSPYYGTVNVAGTVAESTLTLEETNIIPGFPPKEVRCLLHCSLDATSSGNRAISLQGDCDSFPQKEGASNQDCHPVSLSLER
jgi:hypothetical protein